MKLLLLSLLLAGLPPWLSQAVACPEHEGGAKKSRVVIKTSGDGDAPCIVKSGDGAQFVIATAGGAPCVFTADGKSAHTFAFTVTDDKNDGRSEDSVVWVGSKKDAKDRAWLGVSIGDVPEALASQLDIEESGVLVLNVVDGSPADDAGFKKHDIILSVDGNEVEGKTGRAISLIKSNKPGDEVDIVILRDGREETLTVELGSRADVKGMKFEFKFGGAPTAELEERVRTRVRILKRGDSDKWIVEELGDLKALKDLPRHIQMFMPKSGRHSTKIYVRNNKRKIKTSVESDGSTIVIEREGDGPITVRRVDEDGRESEVEYDSADELAKADEEAYELWEKVGDSVVVHLDLDAIEMPDIEIPDIDFSAIKIPDFHFEFDTDAWQEHMEEWKENMEAFGEVYGDKIREWGEGYGQKWEEWAEKFGEQFEGLAEGEVPDDIKFPSMPMFFDHDGNKPFPGLMQLRRHTSKPKHTFEVAGDGSIEVRIRRGDSELVQVFDDKDDLAERNPKLFKKYERMMGLDNE